MEPLSINSMDDLQREKRKLKLMMDVTKHEFEKSLQATKKQAGAAFLKKVLLPLAAAGIGMYAVNRFIASKAHENGQKHEAPPQPQQQEEKHPPLSSQLLNQLLPLAASVLNAFFLKKINDRQVHQEDEVPGYEKRRV